MASKKETVVIYDVKWYAGGRPELVSAVFNVGKEYYTLVDKEQRMTFPRVDGNGRISKWRRSDLCFTPEAAFENHTKQCNIDLTYVRRSLEDKEKRLASLQELIAKNVQKET